MAKFVCNSGTIEFVTDPVNAISLALCINNVTVDISADTVDFNCMGDTGNWANSASATKSWTVSFETALDDTIGVDLADTIGVTGALTFDTVDGLAYSGNAIINSISINAPVDDFATVSWEATGTGALTEA